MNKEYLTPQEVADLLRVSPVTVRQWSQKGLLEAHTTPGGHRRFAPQVVAAFARERGIMLNRAGDDELRILIVDDDDQLRRFLVELLNSREQPHRIETARNGFDAGVKVESFRPDVVLLDLMMPGVDGFEVCLILRDSINRGSLRVIAMTGYPTPENVQRILAAGAQACLAKPLNMHELLLALGFSETDRAKSAEIVERSG